MSTLPTNKIDNSTWLLSVNIPDVNFTIAYGIECILLRFIIVEEQIKAIYTNINEAVYKDSCVEFFISFEPFNGNYYNLEFNCTGNALGSYGTNKNRSFLPPILLSTIRNCTLNSSNKCNGT